MELTSMFLNQLTGKSNLNTFNTSNNNKGFDEFLNKAELKNNTNSYNKNFDKKDNYSKNIKYNEKREPFNESSKRIDAKQSSDNDYKKIDDNSNLVKEDISDEDKAIIVDNDSLKDLSEILGISTDKIMDILSNLSMSISMLQDGKNLINFLQNAFDINNAAQLLSIDNIKNIMDKISEVAKNIDYQDIINCDVKELLNNLSDDKIKNITILNGNEDFKQKISQLLKELNGSIIEENINTDLMQINNSTNLEQKTLDEHIEMQNVDESVVNLEQGKNVKQANNENPYQSSGQSNNNQQGFLGENINKEIEINEETFNISSITNNSKVFNSSLPKTQAFRSINTTDVVNQIMEKIKVEVKPNISEVKMLLKPEQLGEVSLKITTQNGIITAQFIAESQKVKEIIESNFNQLKDLLLEQGINVGGLEVNVSNSEGGEQTYNMFEQNNKNNRTFDNQIENNIEIKENQQKVEQEQLLDSQVNYSI